MMTHEIVIPELVEPSGLQIRERELPPLGKFDVLIAMEATGVSYAENRDAAWPLSGAARVSFRTWL